jgi:PhnB protein
LTHTILHRSREARDGHLQAGMELGTIQTLCRLNARILIGETELMAADIPNAEPMRSAYLTLRMDSNTEAERIFGALSDGGRVLMPMEEAFFAFSFGQVQDQFGINWMILHELPLPQRP